MKKFLLTTMLLMACIFTVSAQTSEVKAKKDTVLVPEWNLKTNLLYDVTTTLSLGFEIGVSPKWSIDVLGAINPWRFKTGSYFNMIIGQPEARYWLGYRQEGHFFAGHLIGGLYHFNKITLPFGIYPSIAKSEFKGGIAGVGLGYGYRWNMNKHWGMEFEIGLGYIYTKYKEVSSNKIYNKHYFGPTKANLSLIYRFGGKKREEVRAEQELDYFAEVLEEQGYTKDTVFRTETIIDTVYVDKIVEVEPKEYLFAQTFNFEAKMTKFNPNFADNAAALAELDKFIEEMNNNSSIEILRVSILGYASVEGTVDNNDKVSYKRTRSLADYISAKSPVLAKKALVGINGEDWEGLSKLVESSNMENKDKAIEIINGPESGRFGKLRKLNGGKDYNRMMNELFPELRRADLVIEYRIK